MILETATFTPNFLKIGAKRIEIKWHGQEHKDHPTLIFLHEGLGCTQMWKDFPKKVSQVTQCPVLVFSRLGYGFSDPCPTPWKINFMHKEALTILPEVIKEAHIKEYLIVGHSDGASIGIIFSGSPYASGLKGLITEAAHVFCEPVTVSCIQQAKIEYEHHSLYQALKKYHGKNTENAFRGWNDVWLNKNFINWNIEKYLKRINVPVLAIQGKNDQYGTIKQIESIKRHVKSVETCLISDCRHAPHFEQPQISLDLITRFVHKVLDRSC